MDHRQQDQDQQDQQDLMDQGFESLIGSLSTLFSFHVYFRLHYITSDAGFNYYLPLYYNVPFATVYGIDGINWRH